MARYHNTQIDGMTYRQWAASQAEAGTPQQEIQDGLEFQFRMPESEARGTALRMVCNPAARAEALAELRGLQQDASADWRERRATERQIAYLRNLGATEIPADLTRGAASQMIEARKGAGHLGYGEDHGDDAVQPAQYEAEMGSEVY